MMGRFMAGAWWLTVAALVAGCSAPSRAPQIDTTDATAPTVEEYRLKPGDSLRVFVWRNEDLSANVSIRPDGRISTPLVEDISAAGLTPMELADVVEARLQEFVRDPVVTIIVEQFVGAGEQLIRIVGDGVAPRAIQYRNGMSLLDVMIEVGQLDEFAAGNRSKIIRRNAEGEAAEIRVRIHDLINDGAVEQNVSMRPGDVVVIPGSGF